MDPEVVRLGAVLGPPHRLEQLALRDELARVVDQHLDHVPLGRRQLHLLAVAMDALGDEVDGEVRRGDARLFGRRGRDAAERGPQAREELAHAERLGDVVVGTGVERGDLVALRLARREDDDGHVGPAAEAGDHVEAGDVGEAEVEDDEVGPVPGRELERDLAGAGRVDVVAARRGDS